MKNFLIALSVICVLSLVCIYAFIPAKIAFSKVVIIKAKINIADRFLLDESKWAKWFPTDSPGNFSTAINKKAFRYKNYFYSIEKRMLDVAQVSISNDQIHLESLITIISINPDSIAMEWKSELPGGSDPLKRIKSYMKARELLNDMDDILKHLQTFLGEKDNVYGIHLYEMMSTDSTLVATKYTTPAYPSTEDIYDLIGDLRKYISSHGATETNFPMLHVREVSDTSFETMVAIPVNKRLAGNDNIFFKGFVPWKVLTAEVKGGTYTVNEALHQMELYLNDYTKTAMAIPFESLVTDRSRQPDTLQWITRIYTPVR